MAKSQDRVEFQIGYSVDKSGLEQMQSMFQQIANKAQEPGKKISDGLKKAGETAATLDKILEKTFNSDLGTLNVTKFNQELAKSNLTLKDVKNNLVAEGNLGATAYNKLTQAILGTNQQLKQSNKLLDSMAKSFKNVLTWGVASSVFNSVTASIQNAYVYAKQLNSSLNDIRIVTDKSAESMEKFAIQANNAAKNLGASTLDYSNAALIYYQQGLSDEEAQARAETTVKAANITGQTGEAVSEQLTAVWNGYKVSAEETELYVDKLAAVAATTAADLEELSVGMSKVASAASTMGVDFDDLNAQMATIVSVTRQAPESVGTALKTIYARLGDLKVDGVDEFGVKLGEVTSNLKAMGIEILDEQGNMRDMTSVMTEVAEKWNTWTEAQKQAAAIAMAGKRQYNNLMALFENWDMYSKALETSADAMGTLQHQQDIYMESTSAKLKTLKATWQDLYDGLIDDDEINAGIDALTNLVQVFDNFIDSFGGGVKSILGFGAVISNVFSKQISSSISEVLQKQQQFRQNLDSAQAKAKLATLGAAEVSKTALPYEQGEQANAETQFKYAQKIYDARVGLNQEQYITLTNYQKEIGHLAGIVQKNEALMENRKKATGLTEEEIKTLKDSGGYIDDINIKYEEQREKIKDINKELKSSDKDIEKIKNIVQTLFDPSGAEALSKSIQDNIYKEEKFKKIIDEIKTGNFEIEGHEKTLKELIDKVTQAQGKQNKATEQYVSYLLEANDAREKQNNLQQQADKMLSAANSTVSVTQAVTTLTSSLSSMAMAWSSVNALIQTFNDENATLEDRITQTLFTLGMTVPTILTSFTKLNEAFGYTTGLMATFEAIQKRNAAISTLNAAGINIETAALKKKTGVTAADLLIQKLINENKIKGINGTALNVAALSKEQKAYILDSFAKKRDRDATIELKSAMDALNTSMLMSPITAFIALLAGLAAGLSYVVQKQKEANKAQIEANNQVIKQIDKTQEEIKANKELYESFKDLYSQYENGEEKKEELRDVTEKLYKSYGLESNYVNKLTDDYKALNAEIDRKREQELEEAKKAANNKITATGENLLPNAREIKQSYLEPFLDELIVQFGSTGGIDPNRVALATKLSAGLENFNTAPKAGEKGMINLEISDYTSPEELTKVYDTVKKNIEDIKNSEEYTTKELYSSEVFQDAVKWVDSMSESIEQYKTALQDLEDINVQEIFFKYSLRDIKQDDLDDYTDKIKKIKEELKELFKGDADRANLVLDEYISNLDNDYVKIERGIQNLNLKLQKEVESWDFKDKQFLFSGAVDFDGIETADALKRAIEFAKTKISEEDLSMVVSLRTKLTSEKKLSKKELEEAAGEESTLSQDYDVELNDFDRQSQLDKVEILNDVVNQKIAINKEYLEHAKEQAKEEKEIEENKIENFKEQKAKLEKQKAEMDRFGADTKNISNQIDSLDDKIFESEKAIEGFQDIIDNGLPIEDINLKIFDAMIAGIDGVISKAEVLSDLASKIGENWAIAGKDIEEFALNFPDLIANQENFNILQDGSLQLTEQGKAAYQDMAEARKQQLLAENQAYQIELQKQADLHKANAEYYQKRAQRLRDYLEGAATAADTEAGMEQDLTEYKQELAKAVGQDDAELTKQIQRNLDNTTKKTQEDLEDQWNYYCSVGETALRASLVDENGEFVPYTSPKGLGFSGGTVRVTEAKSKTGVSDFLLNTSKEAIQTEIDRMEKLAAEEQNEYAIDVSKKMAANSAVQTAIAGFDNAGKGKSKSGKEKEDKEKIRPEIDYLHKYRKAIEETERALKNLRKEKENLRGENLVKALSKENKILEKQRKQYEKLNDAILKGPDHEINNSKNKTKNPRAGEIDSIGKEKYLLQEVGAKFNSDNNVSNYAHIQEKLRDQYNAAVRIYNASGKSNDDEKKLNKAKIYYDEMIKVLKNYEDHAKEYNDNLEKIEEARLQEIANNLSKFETKIKLKHDKQALKREIIEFQKSVNEDIQAAYKDYEVEVEVQVALGSTYAKDVKIDQKAIKKAQEDIERFNNGEDGKYYATIDLAKEALVEAQKKQIEDANNLKQTYQDAWDAYLDGIDQAIEQHDTLYKEFDRIDDELEHQGQLIELVWGEEAYDLRDKFYESQHKSSQNRMASLKNDAETYKKLLDKTLKQNQHSLNNMFNWNEDEKKYYEQWREAQASIREEVEKDIQTLKDKYDNAIKSTLRDLEKQLTGGRLEDVESEWERITKQADKYYDDVEKSYEIQTLANKMDKEIASTKDLKTQQKLKKIRDEEIKMLREKDKLTSYDIKKSELRYQLELKQMALEDARNNKTSMKLTRNAEGNWSYQYVAEEEDVKDKEQDYLDTWHELYELSSDAYNNNLEEQMELYKDFMSDLQDLAEKKNQGYFGQGEEADKKYYEALKQREQQYLDDSAALAKENAQYIDDLKIHSAGLTKTIYDQDVTAFKGMTEEQQRLVTELKNNCVTSYSEIGSAIDTNLGGIGTKVQKVVEDAQPLESLAQNMIDLWNGDDGESVKSATDAATDALVGADNSYITGLQDIEKKSGEVFYGKDGESGMINSMESLAKKTKNVRRKLLNLNSTMEEKMPDMKKRVNRLKKKWEEANSSIQDNIDSLQTYLDMLNNIETPKKIEIVTEYSYIDTSGAKGGSSGSGSTGSGIADLGSNGDNTNKEKLKAKRYASEKYAIVEDDPYGVAGTKKIGLNSEYVKKLQNYISDPNLDSGQKARYEAELKEFKEDYKTQTKLKEELANINKIGDRTEREKRIRALLNKYGNTNIIFDNDNLDEWAKSKGYDAFATGGYTGTWGNDGRLALLHQKELVLNAEDTENLLSGISMIRDMSSLNGSINNSILKAISNMMLSLSGINTGLIGGATTDNSSSNTTFNITAEFPNAENVNDIREAILSLPNLASQFKGQRLK